MRYMAYMSCKTKRLDKTSIVDFLIYWNTRVIFHMSVNASNKSQDANYIKNQKNTMVEEIDSQYVVQIINNNGVNFKKLDLQLIDLKGFFFFCSKCNMLHRPHYQGYWWATINKWQGTIDQEVYLQSSLDTLLNVKVHK